MTKKVHLFHEMSLYNAACFGPKPNLQNRRISQAIFIESNIEISKRNKIYVDIITEYKVFAIPFGIKK
jgi:hypothetical protein